MNVYDRLPDLDERDLAVELALQLCDQERAAAYDFCRELEAAYHQASASSVDRLVLLHSDQAQVVATAAKNSEPVLNQVIVVMSNPVKSNSVVSNSVAQNLTVP